MCLHAELWPYVVARRCASRSQALTAVLIVLSSIVARVRDSDAGKQAPSPGE